MRKASSFEMDTLLLIFAILALMGHGECFHAIGKSAFRQLAATTTRGRGAGASRRMGELRMAGMPYVPYYPDKSKRDQYQWLDIYNALGRERTLFVGRFLDDEACNQLIASLVWLQGQSSKEPITLYFNVPGCIIKPSFAVYDIMRRMECPLITINAGLTVGMGALLCSVGTPGMRYALPNSRFLMGRTGLEDGFQGQASDMALMVADVMKDNVKFCGEMARLTGQPIEKINADMKRDYYLTAAEAAAYGVIDEVMIPKQPVKMMRYRGDDDDVVTFGHFSEVRKVKSGPADKVVQWNAQEFDKYAADQMANQGYDGAGGSRKSSRIDPRTLRNGGGANRFAGSRCKPPAPKKPVDNDRAEDGDGEDPFKNTGW